MQCEEEFMEFKLEDASVIVLQTATARVACIHTHTHTHTHTHMYPHSYRSLDDDINNRNTQMDRHPALCNTLTFCILLLYQQARDLEILEQHNIPENMSKDVRAQLAS